MNDTEICWYYGLRRRHYRVALSDIDDVGFVRFDPFKDLGRISRAGPQLYMVGGFAAAELRLKTGDIIRIGTDDPQGLAAALIRSGLKGDSVTTGSPARLPYRAPDFKSL